MRRRPPPVLIAAVAALILVADVACADTITPETQIAPTRWGALCTRELEAASTAAGRIDPEHRRLKLHTSIYNGDAILEGFLDRPYVDIKAVHVAPCGLPCARYPSEWTDGVDTIGSQAQRYQYRSGAHRVATLYDLPSWSPAARRLLRDALDRCLAVDGPQRRTPAQRCYSALEAARPALTAIDPVLATMQLSLDEASVSAMAPPRYGPKRLMVVLMPCAGCVANPAYDDLSTPSERSHRRVRGDRAISFLIEDTDVARRERILALISPILDECLR